MYHPQVIDLSCSQRNWKQYKDIRTKQRNRLSTDSVEKNMIVQSALILEEKWLEDEPIRVIQTWTDLELIVGKVSAIALFRWPLLLIVSQIVILKVILFV